MAKSTNNRIHVHVKKNRNGHKQKVATLVGDEKNGVIRIGWSMANVKAGDKFDKEKGLEIASARLNSQRGMVLPPFSLIPDIKRFQERCTRYFKSAEDMWQLESSIRHWICH
jgi:hypothetical protein